MRDDGFPGGGAHYVTHNWGVQNTDDPIGKLIGVAWFDQEAGLAFDDGFVDRANIGCYDWPADAHRFEDRKRVGFHSRCEAKDVHRGEQTRNVGPRTGEDHVRAEA